MAMNSRISEIRPYLYLAGFAYDNVTEEDLKELGITHTVDATNHPGILKKNPAIDSLNVYVSDVEEADIKQFFGIVYDFMRVAIEKKGKILVYCMAGMSRSPALVLAFLMRHENISLRQAYKDVYEARRIIAPNSGFWKQLIEYEKEKRKETTVNMIDRIPDVYYDKENPITDIEGFKNRCVVDHEECLCLCAKKLNFD